MLDNFLDFDFSDELLSLDSLLMETSSEREQLPGNCRALSSLLHTLESLYSYKYSTSENGAREPGTAYTPTSC